eukprot:m.1653794 g.1653794  ORF g.1653794 m.1653794 type:complete len:57 (-) comp99403_c0_seq1:61-231(-)
MGTKRSEAKRKPKKAHPPLVGLKSSLASASGKMWTANYWLMMLIVRKELKSEVQIW